MQSISNCEEISDLDLFFNLCYCVCIHIILTYLLKKRQIDRISIRAEQLSNKLHRVFTKIEQIWQKRSQRGLSLHRSAIYLKSRYLQYYINISFITSMNIIL